MLHPAGINIVTFSYLIGNTSPVCLTQNLPPDHEARVLLLGCGDTRNILFTCYADDIVARPRTDITCCDIDCAVLARNILLFTLLLDDNDGVRNQMIWRIYYYLYFDESANSLLRTQSKKLFDLSSSLESWKNSDYAQILSFCNGTTLTKVRSIWESYSTAYTTEKERKSYDTKFKAGIKRAVDLRKTLLGTGLVTTGVRSTAPLFKGLEELPKLFNEFWNHGTLETDKSSRSGLILPNPTFATTSNARTLHYGTDPLLGFHLAVAFAPLTAASPLRVKTKDGLKKIVEAAYTEFQQWARGFREASKHNLKIRFFSGDALAFCHTLQSERPKQGPLNKSWYLSLYEAETLTIDSSSVIGPDAMPLLFDVIDTSNLADHLGLVNLLVAVAKSSADEGMLDQVARYMDPTSHEKGQMSIHLSWKRTSTIAGQSPACHPRTCVDDNDLAYVLFRVYLNMFQDENPTALLASLDRLKLQRLSIPHYDRGSFASLLSLVKASTQANWTKVMDKLIEHIESDQTLTMNFNCIQELYLHLHMFGLHSMPPLKKIYNLQNDAQNSSGIASWKEMPPVTCVTLRVPRYKLGVFTNLAPGEIGTPVVQCAIQSSSGASQPWHNLFTSVHMGFGTLKLSGKRNSSEFQIQIEEDSDQWQGKSPLIVSFQVPTYVLLQQPKTAIVAFGIRPTPSSLPIFMKTLGQEMDVYKTVLGDEASVYVTKYPPGQTGFPSICCCEQKELTSTPDQHGKVSIKAVTEQKGESPKIVSFTGRIDLASDEAKAILSNGASVELIASWPTMLTVSLSNSDCQFDLGFPAPVLKSRSKTRIARKSSYIEVIVPFTNVTDRQSVTNLLSPAVLDKGTPTLWNTTYLNLEKLPALDLKQKSEMSWLNAHISHMFSGIERRMRDANLSGTGNSKDARMNFKDSLFSLFMHFSGEQGQKASLFGISNPDAGGIQIIILVSSLKLDLANQTVVLDAAVIPLTDAIVQSLNPFLQSIVNSGGLCQIRVDADEMRLWKQTLPSLTERCRRWSHKSTCEYKRTCKIPVSDENATSPLCSCGVGHIPKSFACDGVSGASLSLAKKYATHAAISPVFACPFVDDGFKISAQMFDKEMAGAGAAAAAGAGAGVGPADACQVCSKKTAANGAKLLRCSSCKTTKYCSAQCQRSDWPRHKKVCGK